MVVDNKGSRKVDEGVRIPILVDDGGRVRKGHFVDSNNDGVTNLFSGKDGEEFDRLTGGIKKADAVRFFNPDNKAVSNLDVPVSDMAAGAAISLMNAAINPDDNISQKIAFDTMSDLAENLSVRRAPKDEKMVKKDRETIQNMLKLVEKRAKGSEAEKRMVKALERHEKRFGKFAE